MKTVSNDKKQTTQDAVQNFFNGNNEIEKAAKNFFCKLSYPVEYSYNNKPREYKYGIIHSLFQISFFDKEVFDNDNNKKVDVLCIELNKDHYSRTELANITRSIHNDGEINSNKVPFFILFIDSKKDKLSLSIIGFREHKRTSTRVFDKVFLIKDILISNPHRAHIDILSDLDFENLKQKYNNGDDFKDTQQFYAALQKVLNLKELNKKFYQEIAYWFYYSLDKVKFPNDINAANHKQISLIRLLTRIIFVWFLKEKKLVPEDLFNPDKLKNIVKDFLKSESSSNYYNAILQNLFFATLNQKIQERKFAEEGDLSTNRKHYGVKNLYRYAELFQISKKDILKLLENTPFLNGGLFDCLDKEDESDKQKVLYVDGFSRNPKNRAIIPDILFFRNEPIEVDLSRYVEGAKKVKVRGLFNVLNDYKFTVEENTPLDEEVALDPELLGNVFENLLAAYNPETASSARKATGSFYTPREIVNYMCDESIYYYLKTQLPDIDEEIIREILNYSNEGSHALSQLRDEIKEPIVEKLFKIKILDPACGSGAFMMGLLHKLVNILKKIDPDNILWKKIIKDDVLNQHCEAIKKDKEKIQKISDDKIREEALKASENRLKEIEEIFNQEFQMDDYSRKLFIIENSIYGVDIQLIAVQIAKLRFFLSLVIEQKFNNNNVADNFGIRSLPNLELKIVAANTLLKLKGDESSLFRTDGIIQLEDKLKELMHNYFGAQTRDEKIKIQNKIKGTREKIKDKLNKLGCSSKVSQQIAKWNPFDPNQSADWFDPERMLGISEGFDIVIGNPPYISTKGIDKTSKKELEQQYEFADDAYNHFYFKGVDLLKENGILTYISSKTFWTIQTKENLRNLILDNKLLQLFDTVNPFESAMVDTCVTIVQKTNKKSTHPYEFIYLDGKESLNQPKKEKSNIEVYKNAPNKVFFPINNYNLKIYNRYGKKVNDLLNKWWKKISTSKNIEKYKRELENYRQSLNPGDITLLGLITEGGQGLSTANNGKYVGVLEGTKWAENVRKQRPEKLLLATAFCKKEGIKNKADAQAYLNELKEESIRKLFDKLKEEYRRDMFGRGWIFRIVSKNEIADVNKLTDKEKRDGISGIKTYVPYDKGDKDGNRWWAPTPYYIDWSQKNVKFLKDHSGNKGEGMPVVRNPQFYFREGFCWTDVSYDIRARLKEKSVHDVLSMSLFSLMVNCPDFFIVCLLNTSYISKYHNVFVNCTVHFNINDARQLPIIIPTDVQLKFFKDIFNRAVDIQKQKFSGKLPENDAKCDLKSIQKELDKYVEQMYMDIN